MNPSLRVILIDDHQMFREGIRRRLEEEPDLQVVGEAGSAQEAIRMVNDANPTLAILDIRLPDMSGIELARILKNRWPELKLLILTGYDFAQYVRAMARVGIDGYLLKDAPQETLVQAIREIVAGGVVLPPRIASKVMRSYSESAGIDQGREVEKLTVRELEVLELVYQGFRNAEIGERLSISPRTAEGHVRSIVSKLGAQSRTEAVRIAVEHNMIK